ncbi:glycosyltransferase family 2 protein [Clostridium sp. FP2]|uniref:glycosyltransferase family 2 protein n=1 Tax=Clostridium sp. FP2 TaxID=2724481 RepID=UPI0013E96BE4|nr:glycosyltransferase family 2 protein [Clostridium sp. FP2]MBZ9625183.1 glycosyltransferase family 2 protein [Clostridium sp. FP2]
MKIRNDKEKITVLLATYNGEKYLVEQLDSIISQTYINWELWVRDDGSTDQTLEILKQYEGKDNRIIILDNENKKNLGPCMNFNQLCLNVGLNNYIMFCDQDDVWFPDKIELTYNCIIEKEEFIKNNQPIMVFTDYEIVDEKLNRLCKSGYKLISVGEKFFEKPLNTLLAFNFVWGCTLMCNRSLIEKCIPIPQNAENHDFWIALSGAVIGKMYFLDIPTMFYRQHSSNVTGMYEAKKMGNRIKRLFLGWDDMQKRITNSVYHAKCLRERFSSEIPEKKLILIDDFIKCSQKSGFKLFLFAIKNNIKKPKLIQTILFYMNLIVYKYKKISISMKGEH